MAGRVAGMAVSLFVGIYVARYLGPERLGILSYSASFVGLFTALATLGLDGIVVRELVKNPGGRDVLLGTAFCLKVVGAVLMWAIIVVSLLIASNDSQTTTIIAIIAFGVVFQAFNVIDFDFQAEVSSKFTIYAQLFQLAISSIVKLTLVWNGAHLVWFAAAYLFDSLVLAIGLVVVYFKKNGSLRTWYWQWTTAKKLLKDSWPLIISGLAVSIYMKIDQVMIKEMLGPAQVGIYAAAVKLSEAWYFIPVAITTSLFPAIVNARGKSKSLYYHRLQQLYDLMVWLAVAIALPITFIAPWLISFLYGKVFLPASDVLRIHVWAGVFVGLGVASGKFLMAENFQNIALYRTIVGCIVNIALNVIFISYYGVTGAAVATLVSYGVSVFFICSFQESRMQSVAMIKSFFLPVHLIKKSEDHNK